MVLDKIFAFDSAVDRGNDFQAFDYRLGWKNDMNPSLSPFFS